MRNIFLLLSCLLIFSCAGKKEMYDVVRKTPKQKYTPPGTVWLRDNLFIDQAEIENFSWQEFLYWIKRHEPQRYNNLIPDTLCWSRADIGSSHELTSLYLMNSAYRNNPVVGVSYEQALAYCDWRSDRVNELLYLKENKIKQHPDSNYVSRAPKKIRYRLPTKEEWEYAAAAGLDNCKFPMGYESLIDKYGIPVSNTFEYYTLFKKDFNNCNDTLYVIDPTDAAYSGKANKYGLYNMLGNVSELVADSLCKGLNYTRPIYSAKREVNEDDTYTISTETYNYKLETKYRRPEPWLGFRCVCEVLIK